MNDLTPRQPSRPLFWPDIAISLQESLPAVSEPVYIVGGAVRDALLHRPIHDIDLATSGDSLALARQIANRFKGAFFVLDSERGVGRALLDTPDGRMMVDVAHFRGANLLEDLRDRDFTINAMAVDLRGDLNFLIDPLNGENDITIKQIRRCAPHALRSDPVRVLRAVRQSVQLGMRIEPETLNDLRAVVPSITTSSAERIRDELFKLLSLSRPAAAVRVADALGLLAIILPEAIPLHNFVLPAPHISDAWLHTLSTMENLTGILGTISYTRTDHTAASFAFGMVAIQLDRYRKQLHTHVNAFWPNERSHQALLMLTTLLHEIGKTGNSSNHAQLGAKMADKRAEALRLSNAERQRIAAIIQNLDLPLQMEAATPINIHNFWRRLGEAGIDICLLMLADHLGTYGAQLDQKRWLIVVERVRVLLEAYYEKYDQLVAPLTLLDGNQLVAELNLKPGPIIGQLLDAIREAQVESRVHTAEEALDLVRTLLDEKNQKPR